MSKPAGNRKRVLVVDDDPISLQIAALLLGAEGFEVEQAGSGEEALRLLREWPEHAHPAIILADLQMPGISGNALAEGIRKVSDAHLIAMSATEPAHIEGYDAFVQKPLDATAFRALVERSAGETAPKEDDDSAVLDLGVLARLQRVMPPAAVAEVFDACLSDARRRIPQMSKQAEADDLAGVRAAAHTIKGGAGMVGAVRIATLAAQLESNVYQKDDVQPKLDELLRACDEAESILLRYTELRG
jgi:CheY-like chemotaxis protein